MLIWWDFLSCHVRHFSLWTTYLCLIFCLFCFWFLLWGFQLIGSREEWIIFDEKPYERTRPLVADLPRVCVVSIGRLRPSPRPRNCAATVGVGVEAALESQPPNELVFNSVDLISFFSFAASSPAHLSSWCNGSCPATAHRRPGLKR